ncbi:MAG: hypothetical protein AB7P78_03270 [Candidatus Binatia bacterium]
MRWVARLAALAIGVALAVPPVLAESTSERSSSILIFPKVVYDGSRDTVIQISNTSNSMAHAACFYVNATPICLGSGDCLSATCTGRCVPQWQEVDFHIMLTKQQPTHWTVGRGRFTDPTDEPCDRGADDPGRIPTAPNYECDDAGIDPGRVPPVSSFPFQGELRCIEVDQSGAPISGNHLKGEATIVDPFSGDASKYNAIGLLGEPFTNNGDNVLCLGGSVTDECPSGAEYQGCGQRVIVDHFAERADSPLFGPTSTVHTELTLVPCRADYEHQEPTRINVQFLVFNELEQRFSTSTTVDCWRSFIVGTVSNIFDVFTTQTRLVQTHMRSSDGANSGFVGIVEEHHTLGASTTRAALNLHEDGTREKTDLIFIPEGP